MAIARIVIFGVRVIRLVDVFKVIRTGRRAVICITQVHDRGKRVQLSRIFILMVRNSKVAHEKRFIFSRKIFLEQIIRVTGPIHQLMTCVTQLILFVQVGNAPGLTSFQVFNDKQLTGWTGTTGVRFVATRPSRFVPVDVSTISSWARAGLTASDFLLILFQPFTFSTRALIQLIFKNLKKMI